MDDCANAQYPPITGELRKKLAEYQPTEGKFKLITRAVGQTGYAQLVELCDTIDAVHALLERDYQCACDVNERQDMEYMQLKAERDQARADCAVAERESIRLVDEVSRLKEQKEHHDFAPESHYVMLPKDADGVPIHIGDVMENVTAPIRREVTGVGVDCFYAWDDGNDRYSQFSANLYRHYHAPTVEDVLREVVTLCHNTWKEESAFNFYGVDDVMESGNIAEYATKLRLAGDAE